MSAAGTATLLNQSTQTHSLFPSFLLFTERLINGIFEIKKALAYKFGRPTENTEDVNTQIESVASGATSEYCHKLKHLSVFHCSNYAMLFLKNKILLFFLRIHLLLSFRLFQQNYKSPALPRNSWIKYWRRWNVVFPAADWMNSKWSGAIGRKKETKTTTTKTVENNAKTFRVCRTHMYGRVQHGRSSVYSDLVWVHSENMWMWLKIYLSIIYFFYIFSLWTPTLTQRTWQNRIRYILLYNICIVYCIAPTKNEEEKSRI